MQRVVQYKLAHRDLQFYRYIQNQTFAFCTHKCSSIWNTYQWKSTSTISNNRFTRKQKHFIRIDHDPKNVALLWALIEWKGGPFVEAPLGCYRYLLPIPCDEPTWFKQDDHLLGHQSKKSPWATFQFNGQVFIHSQNDCQPAWDVDFTLKRSHKTSMHG